MEITEAIEAGPQRAGPTSMLDIGYSRGVLRHGTRAAGCLILYTWFAARSYPEDIQGGPLFAWERRVASFLHAFRLDSIKKRILAFALLATLVPSLTTAWVSYTHNRESVTQKITTELRNISTHSAVDLTRGHKKLVIQACSHECLGADCRGCQKRRPDDDAQNDPGIAPPPYPLHDAHARLQSLPADTFST